MFRGSPNFDILGYAEDILNKGYPGIIMRCLSDSLRLTVPVPVLRFDSCTAGTVLYKYCTSPVHHSRTRDSNSSKYFCGGALPGWWRLVAPGAQEGLLFLYSTVRFRFLVLELGLLKGQCCFRYHRTLKKRGS